MSKPTLSLKPNKQCEAEGCFATAEEDIKVSVGQIGEINLSVCNDCKPKFTHVDGQINVVQGQQL